MAIKDELNKLLSVVDNKLVVSLSRNGVIHIGGEPADQARLANLKAEAEFFEQSDLWKILTHHTRELAQRAMFLEGDSLDHLKKGRSVLFTLDSQQKVLDILKAFVPKGAPKKVI